MTASKIGWCDRSDWNAGRGCTRKSAGCENCYMEGIAARFSGPGDPFHGFARMTPKGPRWTGKVKVLDERLSLPLRWRKPAVIFANSAFDMFHEGFTDSDIDLFFAIMALCPRHTFLVLTKRPERMRAYFSNPDRNALILMAPVEGHPCGKSGLLCDFKDGLLLPMPNVWLGVSVEDQIAADARIPMLLETLAAHRFVSIEPMLGGVKLLRTPRPGETWDWLTGERETARERTTTPRLEWVICGGETGPRARPMPPTAPHSLRDQCNVTGVPFYFKQWGEWISGAEAHRRGAVPSKQHYPWGVCHPPMARAGARLAGRELDGRTWDETPFARAELAEAV